MGALDAQAVCWADCYPGGQLLAEAISDAHVGLGGIPPELVEWVGFQGVWGAPELVHLAEECHRLKTDLSGRV